MGSGGSLIAEKVSQGLQLELYDDLRFNDAARNLGISPEEQANLHEKPPGFWGQIWTQKPDIYIDLMESVVYQLARGGHGVIIGHAGQVLLSDFSCALHVLILAPDMNRILRIMNEQGLSWKSAEKLIRKADHEKQGFFRFAFHKDLNDPSLYDLVLNTAKLDEDAAAQIIMEAARSGKVQECTHDALDAIERLGLAKRVEAVLLRDTLSLERFQVEVPQNGVVQISGLSYSEEDKEALLDAVKAVKGVQEVRADVAVVPRDSY